MSHRQGAELGTRDLADATAARDRGQANRAGDMPVAATDREAHRRSTAATLVVDAASRDTEDASDHPAQPQQAQPHESPTGSRAAQGRTRPSDGEQGQPVPSWDEIAERYGSVIYTMAFRLTGDRDDARDLAQDVFVRVYRNLDRYQPGTFEGWLYRITKNLFLDRVRRHKRVRLEPLPEEEWRQPSDLTPGPAERIEAGMLRGDLEQALAELPPLFRTAVVLCDVQGLSYEEVAQATGWPLGTVRSRIHRGRRLLRRRLERGGSRD